MPRNVTDQAPVFDLLSQTTRQRLRARIADAGNIEAVAHEIRQQLEAHDATTPSAASAQRHQAVGAHQAIVLAWIVTR